MFSTLNNWLCREIIYNCCFGDYDVAVNFFYDNITLFTDNLYIIMFEFTWSSLGLKDYFKVLNRLNDKSKEEFKMFQRLSNLLITFKIKGGVIS